MIIHAAHEVEGCAMLIFSDKLENDGLFRCFCRVITV